MTNTSFEQFKKMFKQIPENRLNYVHFITLRVNTKMPISLWKKKENWLNYYQVKQKMNTGWNIAVIAIIKGLMFLDIDCKDGKLLVPETVLSKIPATFTVKTRSGGLHFYFLNDGKWDNQLFMIDGVEVGELRANWQYVVAAGSFIEPAGYKILYDVPIAGFEGDITKYFKLCSDKEKKKKPVLLHGKKGKPVSEEHKAMMKNAKNNVSEERTKELIEMLKR